MSSVRWGGAGAIKAAGVCRLVLPGAHVRLLRKESSTRGWVGWLSTRWVGDEEGRFKKLQEVGSLLPLASRVAVFNVSLLSFTSQHELKGWAVRTENQWHQSWQCRLLVGRNSVFR